MAATEKNFASVQDLLRYLKIPGTYKGYRQMVTAIQLAVEDEDRLLNVTSDLYPQVARLHRTTSSCVQKNLRKVISACWENGGREQLEGLLGLTYERRPVTKDFINLLADYLKKHAAP